MKTTLYFIRHGQTEWNKMQKMQGWLNSDLTETGLMQATLLGEKLFQEKIKIDKLYTSPSLRACQTRDLVNKKIQASPFENAALQEINMGLWEGKTYEEIEKNYPESWNNFWHHPEAFNGENEGETFDELMKRSSQFLEQILSDCKGETIGIVSHRITIKTMVAYLLKMPIQKLEDVEPNSLTKIAIDGDKVTLLTYSDISHYSK